MVLADKFNSGNSRLGMNPQNNNKKEADGFDLKNSTIKLKRLLYFNASIRRKNNKIEIEDE